MVDVKSLQSKMEEKLSNNNNKCSNLADEATSLQEISKDQPDQIHKDSAKPATDTKEEYNRIQSIFSHYPGLFSFSTAVKSNKNVWCIVCGKETPLADLNSHVKLDGHEKYFRDIVPTEVGPEIQVIIDKFPGVFSITPNNDALWCNACNKETARTNISRHLAAVLHLKNVRKATKVDVNYENLCMALTDKVFSYLSPSLVLCNVCDLELNDSVTTLQNHVESEQHLKQIKDPMKKRSISDIIAAFGNEVTLGENNKLWCKKCKTHVLPQFKTVERHIATTHHIRNASIFRDTQQMSSQASADEFNRDLAQFFVAHHIPLKQLATMKDFFTKYMQRHIPDESTLRKKYMNEEERKSTKIYPKSKEELKPKRRKKSKKDTNQEVNNMSEVI